MFYVAPFDRQFAPVLIECKSGDFTFYALWVRAVKVRLLLRSSPALSFLGFEVRSKLLLLHVHWFCVGLPLACSLCFGHYPARWLLVFVLKLTKPYLTLTVY